MRITEGRQPERNDSATAPTGRTPSEWIATLPKPRQRTDGAALLTLFGEVTGVPAVMWGPSIVGFGELHYVYESGREGDMPRVGFSPRGANNVLYVLTDDPALPGLLERLGKHRIGVSCLYINKLADVDPDVLRDIVDLAWRTSAPTG